MAGHVYAPEAKIDAEDMKAIKRAAAIHNSDQITARDPAGRMG